MSLDWPTGFERTEPAKREKNRSYEVTLARALDDLERELDLLGVDDWRLSTAAPQRKRDNRPYANANPDDPSAVVRWTKGGDQYAVACDAYSRLRDNVRTIGHYIAEKRKMDQRPVETGQSEFANARLPSGDEPEAVVARAPPHEVLGVSRDASPAEVKRAFRQRVQAAHPDHGGSEAEFRRVTEAKEAMLDE